MVYLTRINGQEFVLNPNLIESIEETPDTVILLHTGKTVMVREKLAEVVEKVWSYQRFVHSPGRPFQKDSVDDRH
jgi:flagellar protein FlbD